MSLDAVFTLYSVLTPYAHLLKGNALILIGAMRENRPRDIISLVTLFNGMTREEAILMLNNTTNAMPYLVQLLTSDEFITTIDLGFKIGVLKNA